MKLRLSLRFLTGTALLLTLTGRAAHADAYFPSDATINYTVNGSAYVGYANQTDRSQGANPTSPIVSLVSGGSIPGGLTAYNSSTVNVSGGSVSDLIAYNSSTVNVSSGSVSNLYAEDSSTVNMYSGSIGGGLFAEGGGTANVSGGSIGAGLFASNGTINVSGGNINGNLSALYSGTLNFFGSNLTDTLVDANYMGYESKYTLTGTLTNGDSLDGKNLIVQNGSGASFHLFNTAATPAPSSVLVLLLGAVPLVGVLRKRRK